jgi:crossover junction endodeoxyribonuclease RuvC
MTTYNLRVLGVDPGTATTGWAVLEENIKNKNICSLQTVAYGHIQTSKKKTDEERLLEISDDLKKIIKKYHPEESAVEKLFFFKNQKTVISVAEARGVILLTLKANGIKISGYTPLQIKQALTGYGRAKKKQIQEMVKKILGLRNIPRPDDAADALAVAICHINSRKLNSLK